jgi:predicted ester cyclase
MNIQEKNKELMITLDDAWNEQDWDVFNDRHANNVAVYWPGQPHPTRGVHNHRQEAIEFFKIFPDNHLTNNPYKTLIAEGDYTCSVADFTGTFKGPMKGPDGKMIQPTNKKFHFGVLYSCALEGYGDSRRKVVLRPDGNAKANGAI